MFGVVKILLKRDFWALFVIVLFAVLAARTLIFQKGYFLMHDDLQMMRQLQMEKCFLDFQIPCRWVPDMGFGYGFPLFNFYPPLPYLVGEVFRVFSFSFVTTAKLSFALSLIFSGVAMYFLAKEFFGTLGGIISSVFYVWAPYRAVDIYVRGAMNESWAFVFFPLIFLFSYKLIKESNKVSRKFIILLALSYFALLTSHNLMVLLFTPFFLIWLAIHIIAGRKPEKLPLLAVSGILALSLSAFFTVPALVENSLTQVRTVLAGYFEYAAHFVNVRQILFDNFWGYGGSAWGVENDGMSFRIGLLYWVLSLFLLFITALKAAINLRSFPSWFRKNPKYVVVSFAVLSGWLSSFMTHSRSTPIYLLFPQLQYIQFPWRFLTIVVFMFSLAVGIIPTLFSSSIKVIRLSLAPFRIFLSSLLLLLPIITNWNLFLPMGGKMGPLTDEEKFSGAAWELQQGGGVTDYLPKTVKTPPKNPRGELVEFTKGEGVVNGQGQGTNWVEAQLKIQSDEAEVRLGIFDFPKWKIFVDGVERQMFIPEEENLGRIHFRVSSGEHVIRAEFKNTPVRTFSNWLSFLTWLGLGFFVVRNYARKGT